MDAGAERLTAGHDRDPAGRRCCSRTRRRPRPVLSSRDPSFSAPKLWVNEIPAWAETSSKRIGPERVLGERGEATGPAIEDRYASFISCLHASISFTGFGTAKQHLGNGVFRGALRAGMAADAHALFAAARPEPALLSRRRSCRNGPAVRSGWRVSQGGLTKNDPSFSTGASPSMTAAPPSAQRPDADLGDGPRRSAASRCTRSGTAGWRPRDRPERKGGVWERAGAGPGPAGLLRPSVPESSAATASPRRQR